jgi:hypothetical protein
MTPLTIGNDMLYCGVEHPISDNEYIISGDATGSSIRPISEIPGKLWRYSFVESDAVTLKDIYPTIIQAMKRSMGIDCMYATAWNRNSPMLTPARNRAAVFQFKRDHWNVESIGDYDTAYKMDLDSILEKDRILWRKSFYLLCGDLSECPRATDLLALSGTIPRCGYMAPGENCADYLQGKNRALAYIQRDDASLPGIIFLSGTQLNISDLVGINVSKIYQGSEAWRAWRRIED